MALSRWGTSSEANAAIDGLNEREHEGRRLTVNEAKPREARTTGIGAAAAAVVADPALTVAVARLSDAEQIHPTL